jgi:hypothetical protein
MKSHSHPPGGSRMPGRVRLLPWTSLKRLQSHYADPQLHDACDSVVIQLYWPFILRL